MPTVTLTDAQIAALDALLHGFDPRHEACVEHDEDDHGDESDCIGWGPQGTADLMAAWDALTATPEPAHA